MPEDAPAYFPYPPGTCPELAPLVGLSRALCLLQALNRSMTLEQAQVFLMVTLLEGRSQTDYAGLCGLSQPTLSRILADLGQARRTRRGAVGSGFLRIDGHGLLEQSADPTTLRRRLVHLTPRGRELARRMAGALQGAVALAA